MFKKLYKIGVLHPFGIIILIKSIIKHGLNLMVLLEFASKWYFKFFTFNEQFTYNLAYNTALNLAKNLQQKNIVSNKQNVAILCKSHNFSILSMFACSRLGANITFLNIDMSQQQLENIIYQKDFDLLIFDDCFEDKLKNITCKKINISAIEHLSNQSISETKLKRKKSGLLNVLTGGTSGVIKIATRKPSIKAMISPFLALLKKLDLDKYKSVYIAVPVYHGYGLASVIMSIFLGAKFYTSEKFDTQKSLEIITENKVNVIIIVPTQLKRMLDFNSDALKNVHRILSGGASLNQTLIHETFKKVGEVLFSLYGTSEVGFSILATPNDLKKYPNTIGKSFKGVHFKIVNLEEKEVAIGEVGELKVKTSWSMKGQKNYISTGDLVYRNNENYMFLKGRIDDMIVSGGENVYPKDIEEVLIGHSGIKEVAVVGIDNEHFGKCLMAFVVSETLTSEDVKKWLKNKVARYQMPFKIYILASLPIMETGKVNKKMLKGFIK